MVILTCENCGVQIVRSPCHIGKHNFCSRRCFALDAKKLVGEKNPFYGKHHTLEMRNHFSKIRSKKLSISDEELSRFYLEEKTSAKEIGKRLGVSDRCIRNKLRKMGIIRTQSESSTITGLRMADHMRRSSRLAKTGAETPDWVFGKYIRRTGKGNHGKAIINEAKKLREQGFRAIPLINPIPDILAIKDGKVYAVEVEMHNPNYDKYLEEKQYDDIIWIVYRKEKKK